MKNNYLIYSMVFISGFSIMSVEMISGKILAPHFGSGIFVWGSIITIFMLALSIGYLLGGNISKKGRSFKLFGLFFFISGFAILVLILMKEQIIMMSEGIEDRRYAALTASFLLFFPLSIMMGMISPYAVKLLSIDVESTGSVAGNLYFFSTIGSTLGTIMTSFYFVLWFDINELLLGLGLIMILQSSLVFLFPNKTSSLN